MNASRLVQLLSNNKLIIEIILIAAVGIGAWMNYAGVKEGPNALLISMSTLAGFYFISAYFLVEVTAILVVIGLKVFAIASSVCVVGLLYTILDLPGGTEILFIGSTTMGVSSLILMYAAASQWENDYIPLFIRIVLLGSISVNTLMNIP